MSFNTKNETSQIKEPMYYECDFYNSSSTWYKPEYFKYADYGEDM